MPKKLEINKHRFVVVFINRGMQCKLINERKRKGDENSREGKKFRRYMEEIKADSKDKSRIEVSRFFENRPNVQFQSPLKASSNAHHKNGLPEQKS